MWPTANSLSEKLALQVVPIFSSDIVEAPIVSDIQTLKKKKKELVQEPYCCKWPDHSCCITKLLETSYNACTYEWFSSQTFFRDRQLM